MKKFLYLDRDYLYSYYAQAFNGLDMTRQKGVTDATASEKERIAESVERSYSAQANIPPILTGEFNKTVTSENLNTRFIELEAAREVATVTLHDNALNEVIRHSKAAESGVKTVGSFVIEKGHFALVDFRYWIDLLTDENIKFIAEKSWDERIKTLNNPTAKEIERGRDAFIKGETNSLRDARRNFQVQASLIQYDVALIINDKIIPLKRDSMKETTREIILKYESEVYVFGRITREHTSIQNNNIGMLKAINENLGGATLSVLKTMNLIRPDAPCVIIDPIAVYVE